MSLIDEIYVLHHGDDCVASGMQMLSSATAMRQRELTDVCHHCNDKKSLAKKAQDASEKVRMHLTCHICVWITARQWGDSLLPASRSSSQSWSGITL